MSNVTLTINMDQKCAECRKQGATGSGLCLKCAVKAMGDKPMKSAEGRAARERFKASFGRSSMNSVRK